MRTALSGAVAIDCDQMTHAVKNDSGESPEAFVGPPVWGARGLRNVCMTL